MPANAGMTTFWNSWIPDSELLLPDRSKLLSFFITGKTSIQKNSQPTASPLPENSLQLAFVKPDSLTTFTAIQIESHKTVVREMSGTLWTRRQLRRVPGRFVLAKFGFHVIDPLAFFQGKIAVLVGMLVKVRIVAQAMRFTLHVSAS
jgi:hypothetical protein